MKEKSKILMVFIGAALIGCSSTPPVPYLPDGRDQRVPVNKFRPRGVSIPEKQDIPNVYSSADFRNLASAKSPSKNEEPIKVRVSIMPDEDTVIGEIRFSPWVSTFNESQKNKLKDMARGHERLHVLGLAVGKSTNERVIDVARRRATNALDILKEIGMTAENVGFEYGTTQMVTEKLVIVKTGG